MNSDLNFNIEISEEQIAKRLSQTERYIKNNCPHCTFNNYSTGQYESSLSNNDQFQGSFYIKKRKSKYYITCDIYTFGPIKHARGFDSSSITHCPWCGRKLGG